MIIPAILTRRLENEIPEAFVARQDACRNEANRLGLHAPEEFGSNLHDENTFASGILGQLDRWKVLIVFDLGDLADSRDELAERLAILDAAGCDLISVAEKIDLRGLDARSIAMKEAFAAWRALPGTQVLPVAYGGGGSGTAAAPAAPTVPDWTPEEEAKVRAHLALHGRGKPADLGKLCGRHWKTAESWLKYAEANPPVTIEDAKYL